MPNLKSQLESLLFLAAKPMSLKSLAKILNSSSQNLEPVLEELRLEYQGRGIQLARIGDEVQMTTSPDNAQLVEGFLKEEISGELTRPSLETLTVVAYRGPISKPELEMIRGVNCSLILRNLLLRGLVEEKTDPKTKMLKYSITFEFLRYLGLSEPKQLPDFQRLSSHEILEKWLADQNQRVGQTPTGQAAPSGQSPPSASL